MGGGGIGGGRGGDGGVRGDGGGGRDVAETLGIPDGSLVALHSHTDLLDAVQYTPGGSYERDVVRQCFRFFGSETEYSARDQHLLLRCLRTTEPKQRQEFFSEVRWKTERLSVGSRAALSSRVPSASTSGIVQASVMADEPVRSTQAGHSCR